MTTDRGATPALETERLVLRLPAAADADEYTLLYGDPEVMRYIGVGQTATRADVEALIARDRHRWQVDGFGQFAVVHRNDGRVIGRVGLLAWDPSRWTNGSRSEIGERAEIELGWILSRHAWGNGYATEAASAVRDWASAQVRPRRLISLIHPGNEPSKRVAAKLGERYERDIVRPFGDINELWTT